MATHQLLDEIGRGILHAAYDDSERSERLARARQQIGKLEAARIVVSLEGPAPVTQAAYEVWRSCSEWHKELRKADPDVLGVELTRSCIWSCQGDADHCMEEAHEACRLAMVR
jgi:GMP synthase-like glutamine amidotransferase